MAPGHENTLPDTDELKQFCNLGYSSACSRLPEQRETDANRFFVTQSGSELIVTFCSERNHAPIEHSVLRFSSTLRVWIMSHANACVQRQAECAVESFLRKKEARAATQGETVISVADDRRPKTDDLSGANDRRPTTNNSVSADDRRPKTDDSACSLLPVEVPVP